MVYFSVIYTPYPTSYLLVYLAESLSRTFATASDRFHTPLL